MNTRSIRILGGIMCLALLCTLALPARASARGHGGGWGWAVPLGLAAVAVAEFAFLARAASCPPPAPVQVVAAPPVQVVATPPVQVVASVPAEDSPALPCAGLSSVVVTSPNLNVRSGPGYGFAVVTVVGQGTALQVLSNSGEWLSVRTPGGTVGWVAQQFTRPAGDAPANG